MQSFLLDNIGNIPERVCLLLPLWYLQSPRFLPSGLGCELVDQTAEEYMHDLRVCGNGTKYTQGRGKTEQPWLAKQLVGRYADANA